jgi:hypothetical protein
MDFFPTLNFKFDQKNVYIMDKFEFFLSQVLGKYLNIIFHFNDGKILSWNIVPILVLVSIKYQVFLLIIFNKKIIIFVLF